MTCTSSTVYVGDLIIMDRHYDGYGHLLSAITFLYDINSLVPPLSLSSYPITIIVVIVLTVSHALTKKASWAIFLFTSFYQRYHWLWNIQKTYRDSKSWSRTRQRVCINSRSAVMKAMRSCSMAALHNWSNTGMSSVCFKVNGNADRMKWREILLNWLSLWVHGKLWV